MKNFKYLLAVCTSLILMVGCKKDIFEDVAFLDGTAASAKLSALYNITQDNTGLVTITPMGEGATSFDIYYGDGTSSHLQFSPAGTYGGSLLINTTAGQHTLSVSPVSGPTPASVNYYVYL